jgi:hypothetical protein
MSKAIDDLKHEHDAILSALKILTTMASRIDHGLDLDKKGVRDFLGFLKEFGDKCHHGKEETILFPAMVKGPPVGWLGGRRTSSAPPLRRDPASDPIRTAGPGKAAKLTTYCSA